MTEPSKVLSKVSDSTLFDHLDTTWEFKAGPTPSTTWLNFNLAFAFKSPLYGQIASVFFDEVSPEHCHSPQKHYTPSVSINFQIGDGF